MQNPQQIQKHYYSSHLNDKNKVRIMIPIQIHNYILKQKIGMGSFAKVFKAIHKPTGQLVAVKVISKRKLSNQDIQRVRKQVNFQKKLFHTNIARIYEFYQDEKKLYIFMQLCVNGQLFTYINKNGPLSQKLSCKVFKQILSAMKYMKSQRLFHRDIKCQNIMFDNHWNAKLVDFGFATQENDGAFSTTFCGSPSYTAPELTKRQKYHSEMIDVWCLGVTLYAMLVGKLPFDSKNTKTTQQNIIDINYEIKNSFSSDSKMIFKEIFVPDHKRASIEDLQNLEFCRNGYPIKSNFINSNIEEITADPNLLESIVDEFDVKSYEIIQSITQFKIDPNYALYYLRVQKELAKGKKVKYEIMSPDFQKKKKKSSTMKLLKVQNENRFANNSDVFSKRNTSELKNKKDIFRIRLNNPSIDLNQARLRKRDDSPQSPKRILDLVSAYRRRN